MFNYIMLRLGLLAGFLRDASESVGQILISTIMDEVMNQKGDILNFVLPKNQLSYIKVIGVGGGGSNAVNHMFRAGIQGVDFVVCNTDAQALESSPVPVKIQLGKGLGAGNVPQVARDAAIEKHDEIKDAIKDAKMLFVTAGMGGGTGTGAAPVVASIAKEIDLAGDEVTKILTVAIVTTPFSFEGRTRIEQAKAGIAELRKYVDAILVINNDKLKAFGKMTLIEAFAMADDVLTTAAKGISEIITVKSYVQIDFKDVNTVMHDSGVALMGFGSAEGENRAETAAMMAMESPLLNDNSIEGAKNMLLYFGYGPEAPLIMDEIDVITSSILRRAGDGVDLIWGAGEDDTLGKSLSITLVATGFNESKALGGGRSVTKISLDEAGKDAQEQQAVQKVSPQPASQPAASAPAARRFVTVLDENSDEEPVFHAEDEHVSREDSEPAVPPSVAPAVEVAPKAAASDLGSQVDDWFSAMSSVFHAPEAAKAEEETPGNFGEPVAVQGRLKKREDEKAWNNVYGDIELVATGKSSHADSRPARLDMPASAGAVAENPVADVAVAEPEKSEKASTSFSQMLKKRFELNHERLERMRKISAQIKTPEELNQIEREPAFKRQGIHLEFTNTASVSEAARHVIGKDGNVVVNDPPFLADKAD